MGFSIKILLVVILLFLNHIQKIDAHGGYCSKTCRGGYKHTICQRGNCHGVGGCEGHREQQHDFRKTVLDVHNELRNKLATGGDTRNGMSSASNMKALSWDYELEKVAQCWINVCELKHDKCRWTENFMSPGQNLYTSSFKLSNLGKIRDAVNMWYEEIKDCNADEVENFKSKGQGNRAIGHFTQVVWADSQYLGCAKSYSKKGSGYLACNYGPGGNILTMPIYKRGDPCSSCGRAKCNNKYKGLCGASSLPDPPPESYFLAATSNSGFKHLVIILAIVIVLFS